MIFGSIRRSTESKASEKYKIAENLLILILNAVRSLIHNIEKIGSKALSAYMRLNATPLLQPAQHFST